MTKPGRFLRLPKPPFTCVRKQALRTARVKIFSKILTLEGHTI